MNYKEFDKKAKVGQDVWICDYRLNKSSIEKPIRHVKPQLVQVTDNGTARNIYYSNVHFRPYSAKGNVLKKIIKPYDNTGYRAFTGVSVNIFMTEKECRKHYVKQCKTIMEELKQEKERKLKFFEDRQGELEKLIEDNR